MLLLLLTHTAARFRPSRLKPVPSVQGGFQILGGNLQGERVGIGGKLTAFAQLTATDGVIFAIPSRTERGVTFPVLAALGDVAPVVGLGSPAAHGATPTGFVFGAAGRHV